MQRHWMTVMMLLARALAHLLTIALLRLAMRLVHGKMIIDLFYIAHIGLGAHDSLHVLAVLLVDGLNLGMTLPLGMTLLCHRMLTGNGMELLAAMVLLAGFRLVVCTECVHLRMLLLLQGSDLLDLLVAESHLSYDVHIDDRINHLMARLVHVGLLYLVVILGHGGHGGHGEAENCEHCLLHNRNCFNG